MKMIVVYHSNKVSDRMINVNPLILSAIVSKRSLVLSIMRIQEMTTRISRITKKIGQPFVYPRRANKSMISQPIAKNQFLKDLYGIFVFSTGRAAPVTKTSEPSRPMPKERDMKKN